MGDVNCYFTFLFVFLFVPSFRARGFWRSPWGHVDWRLRTDWPPDWLVDGSHSSPLDLHFLFAVLHVQAKVRLWMLHAGWCFSPPPIYPDPESKLLIGWFHTICFARVFAVFTAVPLRGSSSGTAWKRETKACPWSMGQWDINASVYTIIRSGAKESRVSKD